MLTILGREHPHAAFCDGTTRRSFLRIGALALGAVGGASFAQLLRAADQSGARQCQKAIINIFLCGGPPHQDMWDLKMDAPAEIRGEFSPIQTNVAGVAGGELFPKMAAMMDKFTILRSIVGSDGQHAAYQCFTGHPRPNSPPGGWPSIGSVVSKLQGPTAPDMPAFVGLSPKMGHAPWSDPGHPGFLGPAHAPFNPNGGGATDMVLQDISLERLKDRRAVLASFHNF